MYSADVYMRIKQFELDKLSYYPFTTAQQRTTVWGNTKKQFNTKKDISLEYNCFAGGAY